MRFTHTAITIFSVLMLSQAVADEPTPTTAPPAAASAAAPSPAAAAATTVAATGSPEAVKASELEEQNKRMRGLGYKPEVQRDGTTLYCHREQTLGTHFDRKTCSTPQELAHRADEARYQTEHVQRTSTTVPASK
jgi:hypothetical protein